LSSSSSFRAERGRRSRDAADADDAAPAHSIICGKMQSFFVRRVLSFVCERGNRTESEKTAFFSLFFIAPKWHRQSPFPSRNRSSKQKLIVPCIQKICRNTRVDSHSHAHALKTFTSSRPRKKKKRERERERYVSFARAFYSFKTRIVVSSSTHLSRVLKIGTLLASLPFLIKNPPRRTQVTQRRKNASTNTHIFKTRMAKYYPDIAKGAKGTRFQTRFIIVFCTVFCSLFCANKSAISHPPPERISTWCLTVLSLIVFF
jgi:hypothetical protein